MLANRSTIDLKKKKVQKMSNSLRENKDKSGLKPLNSKSARSDVCSRHIPTQNNTKEMGSKAYQIPRQNHGRTRNIQLYFTIIISFRY